MEIQGFGKVQMVNGETWHYVRDRGSVVVLAPDAESIGVHDAILNGVREDPPKVQAIIQRRIATPDGVERLGHVIPSEFAWGALVSYEQVRPVPFGVGRWCGSAIFVARGLAHAGIQHAPSVLASVCPMDDAGFILLLSTDERLVAVVSAEKGTVAERTITVSP